MNNVVYNKRDLMFNKGVYCLFFIWLAIMCIFQTELDRLKISLLALLIGASVLKIIFLRKNNIFKRLIFTVLFSIIYLLFLLHGVKYGYDFDLKLVEVFCLRPIILFMLTMLIDTQYKVYKLMRNMIIITNIIIIYNLLCILGNLNIIPQFIFWEQGVSIVSNEMLALRVSNQVSLMYFMPMNIMLFSKFNKISFSKGIKSILLFNVILGTIVVALSGRRALQICSIIAFLCLVLYKCRYRKINLNKFLFRILLVIIILPTIVIIINKISNILGVDNLIDSILSTIFDALNGGKFSGNIRNVQSDILLAQWKMKPIIGWGLSAYVHNFLRSNITKWSYEHVYIAFLFQTGIVGVTIIVIYIINLLRGIYLNYKINRDNEFGLFFIANFVASICFFIAGYTNPLISSMWFWLLILIFSNKKVRYSEERSIDNERKRND